jgi:hypothetical protein
MPSFKLCRNTVLESRLSQANSGLAAASLGMFRTPFCQHAEVLLSALMRCGAQCLDDFYSEVRGKPLKGGYIEVIHTHRRNGQYHPHMHIIATSGGSFPKSLSNDFNNVG